MTYVNMLSEVIGAIKRSGYYYNNSIISLIVIYLFCCWLFSHYAMLSRFSCVRLCATP